MNYFLLTRLVVFILNAPVDKCKEADVGAGGVIKIVGEWFWATHYELVLTSPPPPPKHVSLLPTAGHYHRTFLTSSWFFWLSVHIEIPDYDYSDSDKITRQTWSQYGLDLKCLFVNYFWRHLNIITVIRHEQFFFIVPPFQLSGFSWLFLHYLFPPPLLIAEASP